MIDNVYWLGHASIKITGSNTIYMDPWKIKNDAEKADIVLITHSHYDHCDPSSVDKIIKDDTIVLAPKDCLTKFNNVDIKSVEPGGTFNIKGVKIEAVPAYNAGKSFHSRSNNWVGYMVTIDGKTIYHAGDSDVIPEMEVLKPDIMLLPVGGTYTMNAKEASVIVNKIMPEIAVPIHYGEVIGSSQDAEDFKKLCDCKVEILEAI